MNLFQTVIQFVDATVATGYVMAMAMVCMLQYGYYLYRLRDVRDSHQTEMGLMEHELSAMEKDRSFSSLENHVLREFASHSNFDKGLKVLLKQFVPNLAKGFAAYIQLDEGKLVVRYSLGLSQESIDNLQVDENLISILKRDQFVSVGKLEWRFCRLAKSITPRDLAKVSELNLTLAGDMNEMSGILLTTNLYPVNVTRKDQELFVKRLMNNISGNIKKIQNLERQESEFWLSNEMLTLRGITDQTYSKPLAMLETFLTHLLAKLDADRAALYLLTTDFSSGNMKPLVRAGHNFQKNIQAVWFDHENQLAKSEFERKQLQSFSKQDLAAIGIDSLMGSAVVLPLFQQERLIGVVCLSRKINQAFDALPLKLMSWSGEFLAETILKVINHANIEKQARRDSLTNLANRREFDTQLEAIVKNTQRLGTDCSLLMLDIDKFKLVNDTYGHQAGDEVLKETARIIQEQVLHTRSTDRIIVARYGGEEIAVLLPGFSSAGAFRVADSIRIAVQDAAISWAGTKISVTTSIGISSFPIQAQSASELVASADNALYHAKETGRNKVCGCDSST